MIGWIVDDGIPSRAHRKILFTPNYRLAGVASWAHIENERVVVVDYAGQVVNPDAVKLKKQMTM